MLECVRLHLDRIACAEGAGSRSVHLHCETTGLLLPPVPCALLHNSTASKFLFCEQRDFHTGAVSVHEVDAEKQNSDVDVKFNWDPMESYQ